MVSSTISFLKFFVLLSMALDIVLTEELPEGPLRGTSAIVQCVARGYHGACWLPPGSNFCRKLICAHFTNGTIIPVDLLGPPAYATSCGSGRFCSTTDSCLPASSRIETSGTVDRNREWHRCVGIGPDYVLH